MSTETKTARALPVHYGYVIAFTGLLVMLSAQGLGRFAYPTILPSMRDSLALTYTQTGLLATVNSLGYLISSLFIGQLVIRFGSRWIIASGTFITSLGMLAMSWIPNYTAAVLLQLLVGAASGCAATPIMALPSAWFAARRRGTATGIVAGGGGLGFVASGVLLPPIIAADSANGWRQAWLLLGAAVFVIALVAAVLLRNSPADKGLQQVGAEKGTRPATSRKASLRDVYRNPVLYHISVLAGLNTMAYISYTTFFHAYLTQERGLTIEASGDLYSLAGVLGIVSGAMWGFVSDRLGRRLAIALIFAVQAVGYCAFALGPAWPFFFFSAVLFGLTARANFAVSAAAVGDYVGPSLASAGFGLTGVIAGLGLAIGPFVAGYIRDTTGSFVYAFLGSAALVGVGIVGALFLRPPKTRL